MASNVVTFSQNLGNNYTEYLQVSTLSHSVANNTSEVEVIQYVTRPSEWRPEYYWNSYGNLTSNVEIGGSVVGTNNNITYNFNNNSTIYFARGKRTVKHDADGSLTIQVGAWLNDGINFQNVYMSRNYTLDKISRYAGIKSVSTQATSYTGGTLSISSDLPFNEVAWRAGGDWIYETVPSDTYNTIPIRWLYHHFSGKIDYSIKNTSSGLWSNGSTNFKAFPKPHFKLTVSGQLDAGKALTTEVGTNNPNGRGTVFTRIKGTNIVIIPTKDANPNLKFEHTLTEQNLDDIRRTIPDGTRVILETVLNVKQTGWDDSNFIYEKAIDFRTDVPEIEEVIITDSSGEQDRYDTKGPIQDKSNLTVQVKFKPFTQYSKVTSISFNTTRVQKTFNNPTSGQVFELGRITEGSDFSVEITLTNSRGKTRRISRNINVTPYTEPSASVFNPVRKNGYEAESYLRGMINYTALPKRDGKTYNNSLIMAYAWRELPAGAFSAYADVSAKSIKQGRISVAELDMFMRSFDNKKAFEIQLRVANSLTPTKFSYFKATLQRGIPLISVKENEVDFGVTPKWEGLPLTRQSKDDTNYWGLRTGEGGRNGFLRAPSNGFIPDRSDADLGVGNVGTVGWIFKEMWSKTFSTGRDQPVIGPFQMPVSISSNFNFNDYWKAGTWRIATSNIANGAGNSPGLGAGVLVVSTNGEYTGNSPNQNWLYTWQTFTALNGYTVKRSMATNNGTTPIWSAWRPADVAVDQSDYVVAEASNHTRWASGKMECWGTYSMSINVSTAYGGGFYAGSRPNIKFPVPFVGNISLTATPVDNFVANTVPYELSSTGFNVIYWYALATAPSATRTFSWRAVGRWK